MIKFLNRYLKYIILVIILLVFLFTAIFNPNPKSESVYHTLLKPVIIPLSYTRYKFREIRHFFSTIYIRRSTYLSLREENKKLNMKLVEFNKLSTEYDQLKTDVDFISKLKYKKIIAAVLAKDQNNWFKTLFLDKGSLDGIKVNYAVINSNGIVGHITGVTKRISRLLLLIDSESAIGVRVKGTSYSGIAYGNNSNLLLLKYIPKYAKVMVGQEIITNNKSKIYPPFYPVGTIQKIINTKTNLSLVLEIKPIVDFDNLHFIYVLKNQYLSEINKLENSK